MSMLSRMKNLTNGTTPPPPVTAQAEPVAQVQAPVEVTVQAEPTETAPVQAAYDPIPPPRKRGRPKKDDTETKAAKVETAPVQAEPVAQEAAPAPTEAPTAPAVLTPNALILVPAAQRIHLFFGCAPVGVLTESLNPYANGISTTILAQLGDDALDVRTSDHDALKFGKWKAYVSRYASMHPPPPGYYVIGYGDDLVEACAAGLVARAGPGDVVRG